MSMNGKDAYRQYLQSTKWKTISAQRLAMDGYECVLCGAPAEQVHHRRYPREWGEETVVDLISLCRHCHAAHHGITDTNYLIEKPVPPTGDMVLLREAMRTAEADGDETKSGELLRLYVRMRHAQVVG